LEITLCDVKRTPTIIGACRVLFFFLLKTTVGPTDGTPHGPRVRQDGLLCEQKEKKKSKSWEQKRSFVFLVWGIKLLH
jgi:hypothetical protein